MAVSETYTQYADKSVFLPQPAGPEAGVSSFSDHLCRFSGLWEALGGWRPFHGVGVALALLLFTAAALKGYQLATGPVSEQGLLTSRWFLIAVVEFELFFGLWLLSGLLPRQTCTVAIACFTGFACVTLYKALSGEVSCGCFGRLEVKQGRDGKGAVPRMPGTTGPVESG